MHCRSLAGRVRSADLGVAVGIRVPTDVPACGARLAPALGNKARCAPRANRITSDLGALLEPEPVLLHAGHAPGVPGRGACSFAWGIGTNVLLAPRKSLFIGQFLGGGVGYARKDKHGSE